MADAAEIYDALAHILEPNSVAELRILNTRRRTVSGYYDDFKKMAADAAAWDCKAPGIYFTLNPVQPALLSRSSNRLTEYAKYTTSDADIVCRRWLPVDFDPLRPAGISSTEQEHDAAVSRARRCAQWLASQGWRSYVLADSGNGAHLLYPLPCIENNAVGLRLVEGVLHVLAAKFSDEVVAVDVKTANAARIWKVYGTLAKKGDATDERPHRRASVLHATNEADSTCWAEDVT
jgi:hypothetical protein